MVRVPVVSLSADVRMRPRCGLRVGGWTPLARARRRAGPMSPVIVKRVTNAFRRCSAVTLRIHTPHRNTRTRLGRLLSRPSSLTLSYRTLPGRVQPHTRRDVYVAAVNV